MASSIGSLVGAVDQGTSSTRFLVNQHRFQNGDLEDPWLLVERNLLATQHVTREGFVAQVRGIYERAVEMRDQNWIKELQRACIELALSEQDAFFNFPNPYGSNYTQASHRTNSSVAKWEGMYRGPVQEESLDTPIRCTDTANRQLSQDTKAMTGVPVYNPNDSQKTSRTVTESILHQAMPFMTNVTAIPWILAPKTVVSTESSQPQYPFSNPMQTLTVTEASTERLAHVEFSPGMNKRVKREHSCSRTSSSPKEPRQRTPSWSPQDSMPVITVGGESNVSYRNNLQLQMSLSRESLNTEGSFPADYSPEMNIPGNGEYYPSRGSSNSEEPRRRTPSWSSSDSIPWSMQDEPRERSPSCSPKMLKGSGREPYTNQRFRSGSLHDISYSGESLNTCSSSVHAEYCPEMNMLRRRERSCSRARSSSEEPRQWNSSWSPSYRRKSRVNKWTDPNNNRSPSRETWSRSLLTVHPEYCNEITQTNNIPSENCSSRSYCFEEQMQSNPPWSPSRESPLLMQEDPRQRNPSWSPSGEIPLLIHEDPRQRNPFWSPSGEIPLLMQEDPRQRNPSGSPSGEIPLLMQEDPRQRNPSWSPEIFQRSGREISDPSRTGYLPYRSPRSRSPSWSSENFRRSEREMSDQHRNASPPHRSPRSSPSCSPEIFKRGEKEIFSSENAELVTYHQEEIQQMCPEEGWVEEDPLEILESVKTCMEKAVNNLKALNLSPSQIKCIGITNQRETTLVWDKLTGKPLHNAIVWLDLRTTSTVDKMIEKTPTKSKDHLRALCGLPITTYFSALKLRWLLDNCEDVSKAAAEGRCMFGTVDSWLLWNLTGGVDSGKHITDVTNASRTMLMNIDNLKWDNQLCEFFDIQKDILPEIRSSAEVYGHLTDGPLKGLPISGILGDQQAALVGQLCFKPGQAKNTYGTGCFLLMNSGQKPVSSNNGLLTTVGYQLGPDKPVVYALEGAIAIAGACVRWLRDNLGMIKSSDEIEKLAEKVESTHGCYFVPAFSGLFCPYWQNDARGIICGLSQFTTKEHIARAALEAVCFQTRELLEAMNDDSGIPLQSIQVDGGMTVNNLLMQLQADIMGINVVRPSLTETTALGAAMAAGYAMGIWDLDSLGGKVTTDTFAPTVSKTDRDERFVVWKEAVKRSMKWTTSRDKPGGQRTFWDFFAFGHFVLGTFITMMISQYLKNR